METLRGQDPPIHRNAYIPQRKQGPLSCGVSREPLFVRGLRHRPPHTLQKASAEALQQKKNQINLTLVPAAFFQGKAKLHFKPATNQPRACFTRSRLLAHRPASEGVCSGLPSWASTLYLQASALSCLSLRQGPRGLQARGQHTSMWGGWTGTPSACLSPGPLETANT